MKRLRWLSLPIDVLVEAIGTLMSAARFRSVIRRASNPVGADTIHVRYKSKFQTVA